MSKCVLIVDDEEDVRAIAQHTLNGSRKQQKNLANQCEQCGD
jgi:CheY-like chemotaxis protein